VFSFARSFGRLNVFIGRVQHIIMFRLRGVLSRAYRNDKRIRRTHVFRIYRGRKICHLYFPVKRFPFGDGGAQYPIRRRRSGGNETSFKNDFEPAAGRFDIFLDSTNRTRPHIFDPRRLRSYISLINCRRRYPRTCNEPKTLIKLLRNGRKRRRCFNNNSSLDPVRSH